MNKKRIKPLVRFLGALLAVVSLCGYGIIPQSKAINKTVSSSSEQKITEAGTNKPDIFSNLKEVYPGGMPFGVKLYTEGLMVVGFSDVESANGATNPAKKAGIELSDIILKANGKNITTAEEFVKTIENSSGNTVKLVCERNNKEFECSVTPVKSHDGKYKAGMWLRDSTAGIGTVTFIVPETGVFAGLGHGICDSETGSLIPISRGITSEVKIGEIKKGISGSPGELKGSFIGTKTGNLLINSDNGVFGIFTKKNVSKRGTIPIGNKEELTEGKATILCTLDDNKTSVFEVYISEIHKESTGNKNFIVTVTDSDLIRRTGGIVQGMSGSPIIKDGKLIGAITHVLINDPTRGYGIFVENMIDTANKLAKDNL